VTAHGTAAEESVRASLADGQSMRVSADDWAAMAASFPEIERHATGVAGDLLIVRTGAGLAAVELPTDAERIIRPLADAEAARRFVDERLAQYERMWEGCGCRIDYDA
jgi:hypothetical protein